MKLIAIITLSIKEKHLSDFITLISENQCTSHSIVLIKKEKRWEQYSIELSYSKISIINTIIDIVNYQSDIYRDIEMTSTLEEDLKGGQLIVKGKHELETVNDLKIKIISGNKIIHDKISNGEESKYSGIFNSISVINGLKLNDEKDKNNLYYFHSESERDSVIINRFSGLNSFPMNITYNVIEDFIKSVKSIEENFQCLRFQNIKDFSFFYSGMFESFNKPVLSKDYDELPILFLSIILKLTKIHKLKKDQTSVGIIGIDISSIRLTRLINKCGYMKVLGYDSDENLMMLFEKEKGLATTFENVAMNTDILLISQNTSSDLINYIRPGQFIILSNDSSFTEEEIRERGVKDLISFDESDSTLIVPGIIQGLIKSNNSFFNELQIIKLSDAISKIISDNYELPDFFTNIHEKIANYVAKL